MNKQTITLGEREDKPVVKVLIVIFGILCLFTAGWWTVFLIKYPDNENIFWAGSIFLFLFGLYQIYAGLGKAKRYIQKENDTLVTRQNSLLPAKKFEAKKIKQLEVRSMDMLIHSDEGSKYRIKLGLKYPDLGQTIKDFIIGFAEENDIEVFYKNEAL